MNNRDTLSSSTTRKGVPETAHSQKPVMLTVNDIAAAGIAKCDSYGRTIDVHSLRHTFATLLARNGVSPAIAQKLMRHSDIRLTMNIYTHIELTDTADAVDSLPSLVG